MAEKGVYYVDIGFFTHLSYFQLFLFKIEFKIKTNELNDYMFDISLLFYIVNTLTHLPNKSNFMMWSDNMSSIMAIEN
jgi:hypothetical protein